MTEINFVVSEETGGYFGGDTETTVTGFKTRSKTLISAIHNALFAYRHTGYRYSVYRYSPYEDEDELMPLLSHDDIVAGYGFSAKEI